LPITGTGLKWKTLDLSTKYRLVAGFITGLETMIMNNDTSKSNGNDQSPPQLWAARYIRSTVRNVVHDRLPVGGWLRDIATSENWRMNTIVRRHRDQSVTTKNP